MPANPAYKIVFSKKTDKELQNLASSDRQRVLEKIAKLNFPFPSNFDIKKLVNTSGFFRLRVGKTRTIFEINEENKEIEIRLIGYRGSVY